MSDYFRSDWKRAATVAILVVAVLATSVFVLAKVEEKVRAPDALEVLETEARSLAQDDWGAGVLYLDGVLADPDSFALKPEDIPHVTALREVISDEEKNWFNEVMRIEVECDDAPSCRQRAEDAFQEAMSQLETSDAPAGSLSLVYGDLLAARLYLFEAEIWTLPPEFEGWQEGLDRAREELEQYFREQRIRYHQATSRERHETARQVLNEIKLAFPDNGSREHRWVLAMERNLNSLSGQ